MSSIWIGSQVLQEQSDSPLWVNGDKLQCVRRFRGPYALARSSQPKRGDLGTGDQAGYAVSESRVVKERGGIGLLTVTYEWDPSSGEPEEGATLPADECAITFERQDLPIFKHSNYIGLSDTLVKAVRQLIQNFDEYKAAYEATVTADARARELWGKLKRGNESYALWTPVYKWRLYSWVQPSATVGGAVETPAGPITPPTGVEWLRAADDVSYNGAHWVLERTWIGAPEWDADIYP